MTHEEEDPSATVYKSSIYCAFANGGDCDRTFQLSNLDYQIGLFKSSPPSRILKKLDLYNNPNDHLNMLLVTIEKGKNKVEVGNACLKCPEGNGF